MTEYLHTKLVDTLKASGINPALSEDEIDSYPYVTFELPCEYRYTKDGPYKIVGNLTIRSVSDDFDEADTLRAGIESSIDAGFNGHTEEPEELVVDGPVDEEIVEEVLPPDPEPEPQDPEPESGAEEPGDPAEPDPSDPGEQESAEDIQETAHEYDVYTFSARITDVRKDCMDGVWVIELDYILNQYE